MNNQSNIPKGKRSDENLAHFSCAKCDKWFTVGDAPKQQKEWFCPWCGKEQEFEIIDTKK